MTGPTVECGARYLSLRGALVPVLPNGAYPICSVPGDAASQGILDRGAVAVFTRREWLADVRAAGGIFEGATREITIEDPGSFVRAVHALGLHVLIDVREEGDQLRWGILPYEGRAQ